MYSFFRFQLSFLMIPFFISLQSPLSQSEYHSYQDTCHSIHIKKHVMKAICIDADGSHTSVKLRNWKHCASDITYKDGHLQCSKHMDSTHLATIQGSYLETCVSIGYSKHHALEALCQNTSGRWQQTQLLGANTCAGDIVNINGNLQCIKSH